LPIFRERIIWDFHLGVLEVEKVIEAGTKNNKNLMVKIELFIFPSSFVQITE
jgi:hypothetical protein